MLDQILDKWPLQVFERRVLDRRLFVEHHVTALGHGPQSMIDGLWLWSTHHLPEVERARDRFDEESAERG